MPRTKTEPVRGNLAYNDNYVFMMKHGMNNEIYRFKTEAFSVPYLTPDHIKITKKLRILRCALDDHLKYIKKLQDEMVNDLVVAIIIQRELGYRNKLKRKSYPFLKWKINK